MKHATAEALHEFAFALGLTLAVTVMVMVPAHSAVLTFNLINPDRSGPVNVTYLFTGTITDDTGSALHATDLSFDLETM